MSLLQIALGPFRDNFPPSWYFNELAKFTAAEKNDEKDPFKTNIDLIIGNIQKAYEYQRTHPEQTMLPEKPLQEKSASEAKELDQLKQTNVLLNRELRRVNLELENSRRNLEFMRNVNADIVNQLKSKRNNSAEVEGLQKTVHELRERIERLEFENRQLREHQSAKPREDLQKDVCHLQKSLQREKNIHLAEREQWEKLHKQLKYARDEAYQLYREEKQCRDESDHKLKDMEDALNSHRLRGLADFNNKLTRQFQDAENILKIEDGLAASWSCFNEAIKQLSVRCARLQKETDRRRSLQEKLDRLRNTMLSRHHRRLDRKRFV